MSMVTYPLNNIEYTAEDAELFHSTRTSGVYATDSFDYSVTSADNSIVIGTGIAWIKNRQFSGKVVAQKEPMSLDMGLPDPTYPRIDAVVIQFNSNKNATEIVVKNGAASSFPIAPEVVRTESLYELHLYHVRREAGSLSISAPNITDLRNNNAYCGLMSDSITQAVDSTLSKNGVAADAAAVGNALAKKAPAGYGLGGSAKNLADCNLNDVVDNGWYCYNKDANIENVPSTAASILFVENFYNSSRFCRQTVVVLDEQNNVRTRICHDGNWGLWEFVNPPMYVGGEYKTTERWMGTKSVYTKLVDCGAVINGTKKIPHGASATQMIRCNATLSSGNYRTTIPYNDGTQTINAHADVNNILLAANFMGVNAYAQIWYTKD